MHLVIAASALSDPPLIETYLKKIPDSFNHGIEIVIKIKKVLDQSNSSNEFWTDSMGLDLVKRVRNQRASWNYRVTERVPGNYYPVQAIMGVDGFWVNNDRS